MNQSNGEQHSLKYLGFFRVAVTSTCVYFSTVYEAVKDQAGPLKPGVQDVEDLLKAVIRPLMCLAEENFSKLLDFVDKKVDEKLKLLDDHIPSGIRPIASLVQHLFLDTKGIGLDTPPSKDMRSIDPSYDSFRKVIFMFHLSDIVRFLAPLAIYSAEVFNHIGETFRQNQIPFLASVPEFPIPVLKNVVEMVEDSSEHWHEFEGAC